MFGQLTRLHTNFQCGFNLDLKQLDELIKLSIEGGIIHKVYFICGHPLIDPAMSSPRLNDEIKEEECEDWNKECGDPPPDTSTPPIVLSIEVPDSGAGDTEGSAPTHKGDEPRGDEGTDADATKESSVPAATTEADNKGDDQWKFTRVKGNPRKLFVCNVNYKTSTKRLWDFFQKFGEVQFCEILRDHRRKSRGKGFVTFRKQAGAETALGADEDELQFDDRTLTLAPAEHKVYKGQMKCKLKIPDNQEKPQDSESTTEADQSGSSNSLDETTMAAIDPSSPISFLNNDTMLNIISYLSLPEALQISRVCKRWYHLVCASHRTRESLRIPHQSFMKRLAGNPGESSGPFRDNNLSQMLGRGWPALKTVDLSPAIRGLTEKSVRSIVKHTPNIESLDISGAQFQLLELFKSMKQPLKELKVMKMNKCPALNEDGLWWFLHKHKSLKELHLEDIYRVNGKCFHVMTSQIEVLNLNQMTKLSDFGMEKIQLRGTGLKELYIDNCQAITDKGMASLGKIQTLEKLQLSGSLLKVTPEGLANISNLANLKHLDLHGNSHAVTDSALVQLLDKCKQLRYLDVSSCTALTDGSLSRIGSLPHLSYLNTSYLTQLNDEGLRGMSNASSLTKIFIKGCGRISANGIMQIGTSCLSIEEVDMSMCAQIGNDCLESFIANTNGRDGNAKITLVTGGTNIDCSSIAVPDNLVIVDFDRSDHRLITDRELLITLETNDYDYDDFDDLDDDVQDFLAGDDPLYKERFEMS